MAHTRTGLAAGSGAKIRVEMCIGLQNSSKILEHEKVTLLDEIEMDGTSGFPDAWKQASLSLVI